MYELGLLVAFLIWLYSSVAILLRVNSQFERNLNKIGQRLSWTTGKVVHLDSAKQPFWHKICKYLLIVFTGLVFVLLSWGYVAMAVMSFIYTFSKDIGAPQSVKEFRWKLRNRNLSFDDIVKETVLAAGQPPHNFAEAKEVILSDLEERGFSRRNLTSR